MPRSHLLADQAFSRAAGAPLVGGNTVLIQCDAEESYPAWLHAIAGARRWVHFECYIIHGDATGHRFADALIAKAREGVAVRVVFDWLGAIGATPWTFWRRLRKAGVEVRSFNPLRFDSPLGWLSRDHRKMLAVDGTVAFVTGLCVGDAWAGNPAKNLEPWRDTGVELRGPAIIDVEDAFASIWETTGAPLPAAERVTHGSVREVGDVALRVIASEPAAASVFRLDHLVTALARERLWITDAYFVPTPPYVQALTAAANDGVDVRVLLPGGSDLMLVKPLTEAGYRTLLEGGVRIFEWDGTMVHAKTAVADGRWARVGSSNANVQSWLGNWELDVAIEDERVGARMEEIFTRDLTRSTEIVLGEGARRLERASHVPRATRARRGSRTRAARAGVLRLGHTFGAALTRRRGLGSTEAGALLYGGLLLGALAGVGLKWPRGLAWPLAIFALWLALSWLVQAAKLWKGGRSGKESGSCL
ncbi:MAG: phosphatidylserine/phosphatidylglycerophosphate/cardiolipin synthase family protein [Vicinamibacterales bacterium]